MTAMLERAEHRGGMRMVENALGQRGHMGDLCGGGRTARTAELRERRTARTAETRGQPKRADSRTARTAEPRGQPNRANNEGRAAQ